MEIGNLEFHIYIIFLYINYRILKEIMNVLIQLIYRLF